MSEPKRKRCNWGKCENHATKHVKFGNRTFGTIDAESNPDQNYTILHRNFCERHIEDVRAQYLDVRVYEINECPTCAPRF